MVPGWKVAVKVPFASAVQFTVFVSFRWINWTVTGTRQTESQIERRTGAFPDEIVNRLVRMFSVKGDTVLDPFLGSGTTTKIAIQNERNSIGYETDESLLSLIKMKIGFESTACKLNIIKREN